MTTSKEDAGIVLVITIALMIALFLFQAWMVMLVIGAAHHTFGWIEPYGYTESTLITLGLHIIGSFFKKGSS